MYICPTCFREFRTEEKIRKHFLACWKEQHPHHDSTPAPQSADVVVRNISDGVLDFFNSLQERK